MVLHYIGVETPMIENPTETLAKMVGWGMMIFHQAPGQNMWIEWIFPQRKLPQFCEIMQVEGVDEIKVYTFS